MVWTRDYSEEPDSADCAMLGDVLEALHAERMVVGHTRYDTISNACDQRVWFVDVAMASYYGGSPQVLVITDGELEVVR